MMTDDGRSAAWMMGSIAIVILLTCLFFFGLATCSYTFAKGWDQNSEIGQWYSTLQQPDNGISCCGQGDAYWADEVKTGPDDSIIAVITDTRPDEPLGRQHVPVGTEFLVPKSKINYKQGNPTGHIIIFLMTYNADPAMVADRRVLCYVPQPGL